jgi:hypothetical protein
LNRPNPKAASTLHPWKVRKEMDATWLAVVAVGALVFLVWKMSSYYDAARKKL